jgi:hypothetical protein
MYKLSNTSLLTYISDSITSLPKVFHISTTRKDKAFHMLFKAFHFCFTNLSAIFFTL